MPPPMIRSKHCFTYGIVLDIPASFKDEADTDLILMRLRDFVDDQTLAARAARALPDDETLVSLPDPLRDYARLVRSSSMPFSKDSSDKEHRRPLVLGTSRHQKYQKPFENDFLDAALDVILGKGHGLSAWLYHSKTSWCEGLIVLEHVDSCTFLDDEENEGVEAFDLSSLPAIEDQVNSDLCRVVETLNLKGTTDSPRWFLVAERDDWKELDPSEAGNAMYYRDPNGDLCGFWGKRL